MSAAVLPSWREVLAGATQVLAAAGVASAAHDARELAAYCVGVPRLEPALAPPVTAQVLTAFAAAVERRRRREPLQRITGRATFRYITLAMAPGVFVPRPETEVVAGAAVEHVLGLAGGGAGALVVDLCTGTGAIACAVDSETPALVVAVDAGPAAVELARANLAALGKPSPRVELGDVRSAELLADLRGTVDVVVSNPPYIPPDAVPVDVEVREHDPDLALYGGGLDGLDLPVAVLVAAHRLLRPGGLLVMEHADSQGAATREHAARLGYAAPSTHRDLTGRDRYLTAVR